MKWYVKALSVIMVLSIFTCSPFITASGGVVNDSTSEASKQYVLGDIDGNNVVNTGDVVLLLRYIAKLSELNYGQIVAGDVNVDAQVNVKDAFGILRYSIGYTDSFVEINEANKNSVMISNVVLLVNAEREKENLNPLSMEPAITEASAIRANELTSELSHMRPDGSSWSTILDDKSISYSCAGENIAAGYYSAEAVVAAWMDSEGHRDNIMYSGYTKIGVGYAYDSNSEYGYYWQQLFVG